MENVEVHLKQLRLELAIKKLEMRVARCEPI